jgi:hypothetical protein
LAHHLPRLHERDDIHYSKTEQVIDLNRHAQRAIPSAIGIKGTELITGDTSLVFALDAGFDPYSFQFANGPGSQAAGGLPSRLAMLGILSIIEMPELQRK